MIGEEFGRQLSRTQAILKVRGVSRAVDLDGGWEEIERSDILNSCGSNTI
jgi:hypothetical protein